MNQANELLCLQRSLESKLENKLNCAETENQI